MQIRLSDEHSAQAVVVALEGYGYRARRLGATVLTDCPILLAVAVAERTVGLSRVAKAELESATIPEHTRNPGPAPACQA
jgi:hypothetical protein